MGSMFGNFALYTVGILPLLAAVLCVLVIVLLERLVRHWIRNINLQAKVIEERTWMASQSKNNNRGGGQ